MHEQGHYAIFYFACKKKIPEKGHLAGVVEVHFSHLGVIFILGLRVGDIDNIALICRYYLDGNHHGDDLHARIFPTMTHSHHNWNDTIMITVTTGS